MSTVNLKSGVLNWGVISAGKISNGFAKALSILPEDKHKIVAIAARDLERAKDFAKTFKIENAYGSYEEVAKNEQVEVVYIGSIHPKHFEIAKLMLNSGKHVLCEKPLTMNAKQTAELIEIAGKANLFLMEAVWSRCFPIYDKLREVIESGTIGIVKYVQATFGLKLNNIDRLNLKELGGGTILDLGIYTLQFTQFIYKGEEPKSIKAAGFLNKFETDESANAILTFEGGNTAVISSHACVDLANEAIIVGESGLIRIPFFWRPTTMFVNGKNIEINLPKSPYEEVRPGGMSYEAEEVYNCIRKGLLESPKMTHKESIQLASWMDEMRKQIGVIYEEDKDT